MQYKMVRAILHTKGKDLEWVKKRQADEKKKGVHYVKNPTEEDNQAFIALMDAFDNIEIIGFKSSYTRGYYDFTGWNHLIEANNLKMKEVCYLAEQDPQFGVYINNRDQFEKDWAEGTYELQENFRPWFDPEDLEVLEILHEEGELNA